ncbi:MAG TPA: cytochrome c3 family protein [Polyangia bacterium]|jgi:hypothetical protein
MRLASVVALAATLIWAVALGAGCSRNARRTPPPDPDVITFSHQKHVVEQGTACADCHANVAKQTALPAEIDAPKMAKCGDCHEIKAKDKCGLCHVFAAIPTGYAVWTPPAGKLRFNHSGHLAQTKNSCDPCHAQAAKTVKLSQMRRPGHKECLSCHGHKEDYRALRCDKCHTNLREYPLQAIAIFNHEGNWLAEHKAYGKTNDGACRQCHIERYCDDCHSRHNELIPSVRFPERVDRQLIHRGDWRARHGLETAANPGTCLKCHAEKQCRDCHRVEGIGETDPRGRGPNSPSARPHPTGWMNPVAADFHGTAARRNIVTCAGCHDRGANSNCVNCHRVGGAGGNPHPGGTVRGREGERTKNKMCRICHV